MLNVTANILSAEIASFHVLNINRRGFIVGPAHSFISNGHVVYIPVGFVQFRTDIECSLDVTSDKTFAVTFSSKCTFTFNAIYCNFC